MTLKSWFIQHWPHPDDWDSKENVKVQKRLYKHKEIAIHYEDICDGDPRKYAKRFRKQIAHFNKLADDGGYVCVNFPAIKSMFIGKILPNSKIHCDPTFHYLKRLAVRKVQYVSKDMRIRLLAGAPIQRTVSQWKKIKGKLSAMVEQEWPKPSWDFLLPHEQETICQEYLRRKHQMQYLILPFGRTSEAVDVLAISRSGKSVAAQVTHSDSVSEVRSKVKILNEFHGNLYFFCPWSENIEKIEKQFPKIYFIWTERVWDWLSNERSYFKAIVKT